MLLVEASREAEVREFDVSVLVDQDVIRLDVSKEQASVAGCTLSNSGTHRWIKPMLCTASMAKTHSAM